MLPERVQRLFEPGSRAMQLARLFNDAGHELYLVGGSVRDAILNRTADDQDYDFATDARPEKVKELVGSWAQNLFTAGELFGTVGVVKDGHVLEITTYRSEVYRAESRQPAVEFSDSIEADLSRRDFAVNAMALRLQPGVPEPELVDPWGGLADLAAGVLRTPQSPEVSFGDDPLRMLRLYRFMATLGFTIDPAAAGAARDMAERLEIVSAERIRDEFSKLMLAPAPSAALMGLVEAGLAAHFIPEVPALALEEDPHHRHKDVLAHTLAVVDKTPPRLEIRLAALYHDVGKPDTREFGPGGQVSFHHHEVVGARLARRRLRALQYPKQVIKDVSQLVYLHMRPHTFKDGWTDRAVRRYVRDAGTQLEDLNLLVRCDVTTRNEKLERQIQRRIDDLEERITALREQEELDRLRAPIDGNAVMEYLGISPGPKVGEAMNLLLEYRIDEGPYSREEAFELLDGWVADGIL
ncbi:MAG: CCA tRNA nucleotidyltransferase [Acidimicrobiia bacterium]|nr:CCA tRNA nucleotidyltransferase [Acidimicrobiia bacterium]